MEAEACGADEGAGERVSAARLALGGTARHGGARDDKRVTVDCMGELR